MANFRLEGARIWGAKDELPHTLSVEGDKLVDRLPEGAPYETLRVDDAWVSPGFIDAHVHCFTHVTGPFGLEPDFCGVKQGVTTVIDQGGPSCITLDAFRHFIVEPAHTHTYCFISAYLVGGLLGHRYVDLYGPGCTKAAPVIEAIEKNPDLIGGIKVHADHGGFSRWGTAVLEEARKIGDATGLPLYVHLGTMWTNPEGKSYDPADVLTETAKLLRPGDVLVHPFTRRPSGGILADGSIHPAFKAAKELGLKIDVGRGYHIDYEVARKVLDAGVIPYSISSDVHGFNNGPRSPSEKRFNLFHVMSEMAALGVPVNDVVDMVTKRSVDYLPASARKNPDGGAGLTLFRLIRKSRVFTDYNNHKINGDVTFYPVACILDGKAHLSQMIDLPTPLMHVA